MHIDITDTAAALGLEHVPDLRWAWRSPSGEQVAPALYSISERAIMLWPTPGWGATRELLGDRLPRPFSNDKDVVRWIVAHEAGHALQHERFGTEMFLKMVRRDYLREVYGPVTRHQDLETEAEADAWANQVWRTVKIDGHHARGHR